MLAGRGAMRVLGRPATDLWDHLARNWDQERSVRFPVMNWARELGWLQGNGSLVAVLWAARIPLAPTAGGR